MLGCCRWHAPADCAGVDAAANRACAHAKRIAEIAGGCSCITICRRSLLGESASNGAISYGLRAAAVCDKRRVDCSSIAPGFCRVDGRSVCRTQRCLDACCVFGQSSMLVSRRSRMDMCAERRHCTGSPRTLAMLSKPPNIRASAVQRDSAFCADIGLPCASVTLKSQCERCSIHRYRHRRCGGPQRLGFS